VALVAGTLTVVFDVAQGAYLPALVEPGALVAANARLQVSEQGASVIGPAAGAILVTLVGAPPALIIDAASFVGSAVLLLTIRGREVDYQPDGGPATGLLDEIRAGLAYVASRPSLRAFAIAGGLVNLFLWMISTVLVLHLLRDARLAPSAIGVVLSVGEAGFLLGALTIGRIRGRLRMAGTVTAAVVVMGLAGFPIALAPTALAAPLSALGLFIYGFAAVAWTVSTGGFRQATTPAGLLGRTGSVMRVAAWGPIPIAALFAGTVAAGAGTRAAMLVGAIGATTAMLPVLAWRAQGTPD
jgi:Transmembrane secretion effector